MDDTYYCFKANQPAIHDVKVKTFGYGYLKMVNVPFLIRICDFKYKLNVDEEQVKLVITKEMGLSHSINKILPFFTTELLPPCESNFLK